MIRRALCIVYRNKYYRYYNDSTVYEFLINTFPEFVNLLIVLILHEPKNLFLK